MKTQDMILGGLLGGAVIYLVKNPTKMKLFSDVVKEIVKVHPELFLADERPREKVKMLGRKVQT